ncbi:NmrA family NAD(P)-binding protein [Spirosoma rhododendri]|uniref:NmrA family NAD(P)-binding protein n=1 Tax=Spirosoma rhododendri TaxID=2728024 RepID=A0A7L5E172_9BACT|nr:NmrA family NAD(P)-binding protein [Spirosoma rhododendri]QJD81500.1 NmrA family NAD(P)-binding protein [Spirosoma rhododendri]
MKNTIVMFGATGHLGTRIVRELVKRGASVRAVVRTATDPEKLRTLAQLGATVEEVDMDNVDALVKASKGAGCVVSALAGLGDVIVDLQKRILNGALQAGVPRFIPSDFCTDYMDLMPGENRNFDLRRAFRDYIDQTSIQATSVFNGAFADILQYNTPVLNLKEKSIGYWGEKANWPLDFTTMDDTAAFTAEVALDDETPRNLQIASFQISPTGLWQDVKQATGQTFRLHQLASLDDFAQHIKRQRADYPAGEQELYAKWQQGQYLYSMFTTHHTQLANERYRELTWTTSLAFIQSFIQ